VILVYDATDKSALRRLSKWAAEVAADGTFVAPFPDDTAARWGGAQGARGARGATAAVGLNSLGGQRRARRRARPSLRQARNAPPSPRAAPRRPLTAPACTARPLAAAPLPPNRARRNIGGLPVPVLIVANKADRLRGGGGAAAAGALALQSTISRLCGGGAAGAGGGPVAWLCDALRGLRGGARVRGAASSGGVLPVGGSSANLAELESSIRSVSASAATGALDWATVGAFFTALWARRYQPNTRSASAFLQQLPAGGRGLGPGGGVGLGGALFAPGGGGVVARRVDDDEDRRLDDYV
jgi:hypothetical protein